MHLQILPNVQNREFYYFSILNKIKWALLFGGERVLLYQRRWTGTRCPNFDQIRKAHPVDSSDDICYGTGYVDGYYRPIEIYVSLLSAVAIQNISQDEGIRKIFKPSSWTLWEPHIRNGDFIVRQNNQRLWINNVNETRWKAHILRQQFETELVEKGHPIYRIPA